jgi:hypothetical protein
MSAIVFGSFLSVIPLKSLASSKPLASRTGCCGSSSSHFFFFFSADFCGTLCPFYWFLFSLSVSASEAVALGDIGLYEIDLPSFLYRCKYDHLNLHFSLV